jgi:Flp pilus assembly protein TadD
LEQVLRNDSADAQTWLDAGDIFVWMGRRDRARTYWKKAQALSDNNADVRAGASRRLNKLLPQEQKSESVEERRP